MVRELWFMIEGRINSFETSSIAEKRIIAEIAENISWTVQVCPLSESQKDDQVLQRCYSWLA